MTKPRNFITHTKLAPRNNHHPRHPRRRRRTEYESNSVPAATTVIVSSPRFDRPRKPGNSLLCIPNPRRKTSRKHGCAYQTRAENQPPSPPAPSKNQTAYRPQALLLSHRPTSTGPPTGNSLLRTPNSRRESSHKHRAYQVASQTLAANQAAIIAAVTAQASASLVARKVLLGCHNGGLDAPRR
jgi:hypothetical protein